MHAPEGAGKLPPVRSGLFSESTGPDGAARESDAGRSCWSAGTDSARGCRVPGHTPQRNHQELGTDDLGNQRPCPGVVQKGRLERSVCVQECSLPHAAVTAKGQAGRALKAPGNLATAHAGGGRS